MVPDWKTIEAMMVGAVLALVGLTAAILWAL